MQRVLTEIQDPTAGNDRGAADPPAVVSLEERHQMIAAAAYRRYEQRAGAPGDLLNDWLEAEREVDRSLWEQGATLAERIGDAKSVFLRSLSALLAESQAQLESLASKAMAANAMLRRKYEEQRPLAAAKCEVARGKLAEIRAHTGGAWGHLKDGAEKAAHEMSIAVRQLTSLFS